MVTGTACLSFFQEARWAFCTCCKRVPGGWAHKAARGLGPARAQLSFPAHLLARGQGKSWRQHRFKVGKLEATSDVESCPGTA